MHTRTLAAVACLVFVSILSIVLYLTSDRTVPQVDQNHTGTQSVTNVEQTGDSSNSGAQGTATENKTDNQNGSIVQLPTQPYEVIEPPEGETIKPTEGATTNPTENEGKEPTQGDTQKPDVEPTSPPPEDETLSEDVGPNEPIAPSETIAPSTESPTEGREPSTESGAPSMPECVIYFTNMVSTEKIYNGIGVYCKVYSPSGKLIGDADLYSAQHQAYAYYYSTEKMILSYELSYDYFTESGTYTYYFYNQYGDILCQGTKTI